MKKKGQTSIGGIIIAAILIFVGLAMMFSGSVPQSIGDMTKTGTNNNKTMNMPGQGATAEITTCGQKALTYTITNATGGEIVPTTNYTISQSAGTDGYLAAKVTTGTTSNYANRSVNVSCTYEPKGYVVEGGSRAIVGLVAIFAAMLILVAALPDIKNGILDLVRG